MKPYQSKFFSLFAVVLIAGPLLVACAAPTAPVAPTAMDMSDTSVSSSYTADSPSKIDSLVFHQAVRKLWEDHITWTRLYIISAIAELPDADAAAQRLLQNQTDIGDAIKAFYGEDAGAQLTSLLNDHILTAVDLLVAAKSGDTAGFEEANQRWYDNADQIATFLSSANPKNWPLSDMQAMMKSHLDLTLEEATARLNQDWAGDVVAYDKVHDEILQMADMLADGIIAQFPEMFS